MNGGGGANQTDTDHDLVLGGEGHLAVVKVVPLTVVLVARVAGVCAEKRISVTNGRHGRADDDLKPKRPTVSVPQASVVIGHGDEVVATRRLLAGHASPQEEAGEAQVPATAAATTVQSRRLRGFQSTFKDGNS